MEHVLIPIAGMAIPIIIVPTVLAMKHVRQKREWEHLERIRALELGQPVPGSEVSRAVVAGVIGAGVPIGSFLFAWLASMTSHVDESVWAGASIVGIGGVIGGVLLAKQLLGTRAPATSEPTSLANGKPVVDPDAYDIAGRRG
jgi:hypothetical protein